MCNAVACVARWNFTTTGCSASTFNDHAENGRPGQQIGVAGSAMSYTRQLHLTVQYQITAIYTLLNALLFLLLLTISFGVRDPTSQKCRREKINHPENENLVFFSESFLQQTCSTHFFLGRLVFLSFKLHTAEQIPRCKIRCASAAAASARLFGENYEAFTSESKIRRISSSAVVF